jgi:hypothetical protein
MLKGLKKLKNNIEQNFRKQTTINLNLPKEEEARMRLFSLLFSLFMTPILGPLESHFI